MRDLVVEEARTRVAAHFESADINGVIERRGVPSRSNRAMVAPGQERARREALRNVALQSRDEMWPIERLREYLRNPRKNDKAVDRMCASIREFGLKTPCLVQRVENSPIFFTWPINQHLDHHRELAEILVYGKQSM